MQQVARKLNSEGSNLMFNLQTLFRSKLTYNDLVVYDIHEWQPDTTKIRRVAVIGRENYDQPTTANYIKDTAEGYFYYFPADQEYHTADVEVLYDAQAFKNAKWFKCSGRFKYADPEIFFRHIMVLSINRDDEVILWKGCIIENKVAIDPNEDLNLYHFVRDVWGNVHFFVKIPDDLKQDDKIKLSIWNIPKRELYADDLLLELYE